VSRWLGPDDPLRVELTLNGEAAALETHVRATLADAVRATGLTGTHLGCEHGVCGACTVVLDGDPVRACLVLAAQAEGRRVDTVESLGTPDALHPAQQALRDARGLQCGFCTPGVAVLSAWLREREPEADEARIREVLSSSLCRCTGYGPIVAAARRR
jgi:aerobic carbon-monoxide dehydrogenase small subunit